MINLLSILNQLRVVKQIKPELIGDLWQLARRVAALRQPDGLYEVLDYESRLIMVKLY